MTTSTGLTDLIGVANIRTLTPSTSWRPRPARDRLRVAIGVGTTGQAVELDIKEAAQGGMGPHGLVVGATGSGKSELLRTLVLGLAITHPPDYLNFVLVDFKGGATFNKLDALPHTSAVITNLSDELGLVDRMKDAINGELNRRMELLRSAGTFASLRDYDQARALGTDLPAIPTLLIVVDEFSELLTAKPDFLDLFITIGRVGRSLGVHLLLASQRLEEGRLRGLDTYLSYRIGLKTFSVAESRIVLGAPDAFELPTAPGNGYLKFDTTGLVRFKGAYVSGPVRDSRVGADDLGWVDPQAFRLVAATSGATGAARAAVGAGDQRRRPGGRRHPGTGFGRHRRRRPGRAHGFRPDAARRRRLPARRVGGAGSRGVVAAAEGTPVTGSVAAQRVRSAELSGRTAHRCRRRRSCRCRWAGWTSPSTRPEAC